jgi:protocatechuate 3,4-dioxygenase beta subunit
MKMDGISSVLLSSAFFLHVLAISQTYSHSLGQKAEVVVLEGSIKDPVRAVINLTVGNRTITYRTDSTGYYRFEAVAKASKIVSVRADGYFSSSKRILAGEDGRMDFALSPAVQVRGFVTDRNGNPIGNARIRVFYPLDKPELVPYGDEVGPFETSATGDFILPYVKAGERLYLEISKPNYLPVFSGPVTADYHAMEDVRIRVEGALVRASIINGVVRDHNGEPVSGAQVEIKRVVSDSVPTEIRSLSRVQTHFEEGHVDLVTTGSDGTFTFTGVAPGANELTVRHPGFRPITKEVSVTPESVITERINLTAAP